MASAEDNAALGDVVLLKNTQYPPSLWPMGIITKVFPGEDDLVRVADIKTAASSFTRPIVKLVPLIRSSQSRESNDCNLKD